MLALSLLASAVYAVLSLLSAPLKGVHVASVNQTNELARQLVGIAFSLAPVWLVVHLLKRSGEGVQAIGLAWDRPAHDLKLGAAFFAVVGLGGLAFYLGAVALGVNRFVVPVPPLGHWWTVPVLLLNAAAAALLEETIVLGYLITRLRQLAWSPFAAVAASAHPPRLVPPVSGVGRVRGQPGHGHPVRCRVPPAPPDVAVRLRALLPGRRRGHRVHPVPAPSARLLVRMRPRW